MNIFFQLASMVRQSGEGDGWGCTVCGVVMKHRKSLKVHVETHVPGMNHACFCEKTYRSKRDLRKHIDKYHGQGSKEHVEYLEKKKSKKIAKMFNHENGSQEYEQFEQEMIAKLPWQHRLPLLFVTKEDPEMTCPFCGMVFAQMFKFIEHKKRYVYKNMWACPEPDCEKRYKGSIDRKHLKAHLDKHRASEEISVIFNKSNQLFCEFCGKSYVSKNALTRHVDIIHNEEGK